jgi:hypothetical protein
MLSSNLQWIREEKCIDHGGDRDVHHQWWAFTPFYLKPQSLQATCSVVHAGQESFFKKQSKPTALAYRFCEYLADVLRARLA